MDVRTCLETLLRDGFILVFNQDRLDVVKTAQALLEAGIHNMEVTCRIKKPLENIERLRRHLPDLVVGAASLVDFPEMLDTYNRAHPVDPLPSLQQAVDAGADYLVSAVAFRKESYSAYAGRLVMIPGCGTTTEIVGQYSMGAHMCKVFPAKQLGGPSFIKALDPAIHKTVSLVPTGGINRENIPEYIDAGVLVVGASFGMIDRPVLDKVVEEQDYGVLTEEFVKAKRLIDTARSGKWPEVDWSRCSLEDVTDVTGRLFNV